MLSAFLSGRFKAESRHKILGHHKADLPVNQHMAPFSRYAQHPNLRSVRIQRHRVNAGRSLPSQIGALPIGILNRHLGQQFGLLVFGRVKIEELIFSYILQDCRFEPGSIRRSLFERLRPCIHCNICRATRCSPFFPRADSVDPSKSDYEPAPSHSRRSNCPSADPAPSRQPLQTRYIPESERATIST